MSIVLLDGTIHESVEGSERTTKCGIDYTRSGADDVKLLGTKYIDEVVADMHHDHPDAEKCEECFS